MKRIVIASLLALSSAITSSASESATKSVQGAADVICMDYALMKRTLASEFNERIEEWRIVGESVYVLFVNRSAGTFTIVRRSPTGRACMVAAGKRNFSREA